MQVKTDNMFVYLKYNLKIIKKQLQKNLPEKKVYVDDFFGRSPAQIFYRPGETTTLVLMCCLFFNTKREKLVCFRALNFADFVLTFCNFSLTALFYNTFYSFKCGVAKLRKNFFFNFREANLLLKHKKLGFSIKTKSKYR